MLSDLVLAGDKVELRAAEQLLVKEGDNVKTYTTKVFDILEDDRLEIAMPMEKTKLILLPIDGEYEITFYTSSGLYQCYARIIDRYKSNNVYVLSLELTSNLRKQQRREYFRFSCVMDMKCRGLQNVEVESLSKSAHTFIVGLPLRRGVICDISGGGMRFITDVLYEADSYAYCTFQLDMGGRRKDYEVIGKVLNSKELDNRPGEYEHRIKYMGLGRDTREDIIKYIFEEERRMRRNSR